MHVINTLAPIFLLVGIGAFLKKRNFLSEEFFTGMNKLTFWVGLPFLLFYKISGSSFELGDAGRVFAVLVIGLFAGVPVFYWVAKWIKLPDTSIGTFVQSCFRCNTAFVGLPVIIYAFSGSDVTKIATMAIAPMIPISNIASLLTLMPKDDAKDRKTMIFFYLKRSLKNPMVIACLVALPFSIFSIPLPDFINRGCEALGRMALPLALLSIGSSLSFLKIQGNITAAIYASAFNVILLPLIGLLASFVIPLTGQELAVCLILLACPAASSSYVMVQQMKGDEALSSSVIVISTLMALLPLSIIIAFFL